MLTPGQFDVSADAILKLYHEFEDVVLQDIARRLAGLNFASAAWQVQRLNETGALYEDILRELARLTGQSERQVAEILRQAGVQAVRFDDRIYRAAGLDPLPLNLSPQMASVLSIAIQRTNGSMRNLTQTTVLTAQQAFVQAADMAFLQVSSGAMSYDQAIRAAVGNVGASGLEVMYPSGRRDKLDVAMRRTVLTGVGQAAGQLQWARADEMGADLVQTSAHIGARPSHQLWQGRIFSRSGTHPLYPPFVAETGWGTVTGLGGANCRHSYFPFFEGLSENAYDEAMREHLANESVDYRGRQLTAYEATQVQRGLERKIREWKRRALTLEAAGLDTARESAKVRLWQARMRDFVGQTGLRRQRVREQI
jgi:hypothetical protein